MFQKLEISRMAQAMASHAGSRMGVVARNIANADTPGFKARDLPDFSVAYTAQSKAEMRATRPNHIGGTIAKSAVEPEIVRAISAPNGNSVSLESEMVKAAEIRQQHDMALSIYRASSDIMKLALGRGR
jgi:flagellar basal-body rod protein FlgB